MNSFNRLLIMSAALLAISPTAFSEEAEYEPFFEILVMGGWSFADMTDATMTINEVEVDKLEQTNEGDWNAWTAQLGLGYVYFLTDDFDTDDLQWFPVINPQLNLYYFNTNDIEGDVLRFEDPNANQMDYDMHFNSTRLMFDVALTVAQLQEFSIYAIAGAGVSWNNVDDFSATEKDGVDCGIQPIDLDSNSSTSFAYEFGGGLSYAINTDLSVSVEYLYAGINDIDLGNDEDVENLNVAGSDFDINTQSVLLGLRFAL